MKKIILPSLFGLLLLGSCKKDYTCSCTSTSTRTDSSGPSVDVSNDKMTFTKVSKKFMTDKAECYSTENTYTDAEGEALGFNLSTGEMMYGPVTYSTVNTCTISK